MRLIDHLWKVVICDSVLCFVLNINFFGVLFVNELFVDTLSLDLWTKKFFFFFYMKRSNYILGVRNNDNEQLFIILH